MAGNQFRKASHLLAYSLVVAFVGGCATAPARNDPAVEDARSAYSAAAERPHVKEYAPIPLREAYLNLRRAEEAESAAARNHFAYLAERQAALALAMTHRRIAEDEMAQLAEDRDSLVLRSQRQRTQEAEMEADRLRRERELAREQAERFRWESEREMQRLREQLAELEARETDRGLVLTLDNFLFETNRADLKAGAFRSLEKLSDFLKQNPGRNIMVEGHTDSTGSAQYNLDLSRRRAEAVAQALRSQGIQPDRIITRGYGQEYPVASNDTSSGRLQNRRVEVVIENATETRAGTARQ
ncbi:MAG: flagellar motor protein MotB [Deltaproteobacteria bacterium HGW-Deltaproteobacteria-21]|nr:MAG: flagellar motor protein MotB [Deltaproteobacteria bacterium HGW-Deltaproteobacteria-21]